MSGLQSAVESVVSEQEHIGERMPKLYMALERAIIAERYKFILYISFHDIL